MQKLPNTHIVCTFFSNSQQNYLDAEMMKCVRACGICVFLVYSVVWWKKKSDEQQQEEKKKRTKNPNKLNFMKMKYVHRRRWSASWALIRNSLWLCTSYASFIYKYELLMVHSWIYTVRAHLNTHTHIFCVLCVCMCVCAVEVHFSPIPKWHRLHIMNIMTNRSQNAPSSQFQFVVIHKMQSVVCDQESFHYSR